MFLSWEFHKVDEIDRVEGCLEVRTVAKKKKTIILASELMVPLLWCTLLSQL
jgi:hypothetical protein